MGGIVDPAFVGRQVAMETGMYVANNSDGYYDSHMNDRPPHLGLRHLAIYVRAFEETKRFYVDLLGFKVEWEPDKDNTYLTSGNDNLALHRVAEDHGPRETVLDHFGLIVRRPEDVDAWATYLEQRGVTVVESPKTHRDGARSFYLQDPDGNQIQIIHHPPISNA